MTVEQIEFYYSAVRVTCLLRNTPVILAELLRVILK